MLKPPGTHYQKDSKTSEHSVRRHPTFYLVTGDVVLSADEGNIKYMFCVHKTVLGHYSPVFADMFAIPTRVDVNETYEGLPIVHLYDEAADIEHFLKALYNFGCVASLVVHV